MIFGRTENGGKLHPRAAKDCSYLYEIPRSRVAKHVIGPRFSWSWLDHVSDESLVVVNIAVESCVSEDLLKTCASVELVSELYYCQTRMTALVMVEPFNRALDIGKKHPGTKRTHPSQGRDDPKAGHTAYFAHDEDVAVSKFEKYLRVMEIPGTIAFCHGFHDIQYADLRALKTSVTSRPPLAVPWLCSNVLIAYHFQPRPRIVRPVCEQ